jgi:hypothetical protein
MNEEQEKAQNQDHASDVESCCAGGDCCPSGSAGGTQRWKAVVFILIVISAGAVLANSLVRRLHTDSVDQPKQVFATTQVDTCCLAPVQSSAETAVSPVADEAKEQDLTVKESITLWNTELASLSSLNQVATGADAVFVLLGSQGQKANKGMTREMEAALAKIQSNGTRVSTFWLKDSAPEYANLAKQMTFPCVLAMVKGGGMSVVSDEISEARLVQAFVAASRPSSCGPSGCGPAGCN